MRGTGFARPAHVLVSAVAPALASGLCGFRDQEADPLARVARRSGRSSCCPHAEPPHASPRGIVRWESAHSRSGRSSGSSAPSRSVDCDCRSRTVPIAALRRSSARFHGDSAPCQHLHGRDRDSASRRPSETSDQKRARTATTRRSSRLFQSHCRQRHHARCRNSRMITLRHEGSRPPSKALQGPTRPIPPGSPRAPRGALAGAGFAARARRCRLSSASCSCDQAARSTLTS